MSRLDSFKSAPALLKSPRGRALVSTIAVVVVMAILILMPNMLGGSKYWLKVLTLIAINVLLVSSVRSVNLINEISLGQVGFAVVGAYTQALLVMKVGLGFWPALILSGLLAALVALLLGYPFLKVKGIYFSILTLLTAEVFRSVAYYWKGLTGGTLGIQNIPRPGPMFGGLVKFEAPSINYYYLALGVVFVCLLILYHFERAYMNFQWRMIQDDSTLAGATGVNVIGTKIVNFTISGFMAGIAGALVASYQGNLGAGTTTRFATTASITLLVYMVVGGRGRFVGPIIGTVVMMVLDELARPMGNSRPILTGAIAIAVMIFMPMGLVGLPAQIREQRRKRRVKLLDKAVRSD